MPLQVVQRLVIVLPMLEIMPALPLVLPLMLLRVGDKSLGTNAVTAMVVCAKTTAPTMAHVRKTPTANVSQVLMESLSGLDLIALFVLAPVILRG
jgi:hypothetical protein